VNIFEAPKVVGGPESETSSNNVRPLIKKTVAFLAIPRLPRHWAYFVVTTTLIWGTLVGYQRYSWTQYSLHQMPAVLVTYFVNGMVQLLLYVAVLFGLGLFALRSARRFFRAPLPFSTSRRAVEFVQKVLRWLISVGIYLLVFYVVISFLDQNFWTFEIGIAALLQYPLYRIWVHVRSMHRWWRQRQSIALSAFDEVVSLARGVARVSKEIWNYFFAERPSVN